MYSFRKSKKGFTLIELMVVVAIIGVLVLLGLRAYSSQKQRAMNAIAKANASTIQTMLVGYMGDHDILLAGTAPIGAAAIAEALGPANSPLESMVNPYSETLNVYVYDPLSSGTSSAFTADWDPDINYHGMVVVLLVNDNIVLVNALDQDGKPIWDSVHALPANKY